MARWQRFWYWAFGLTPPQTPLDRADELLQHGRFEDALFTCRDVIFRLLTDLARATGVALRHGDQDEIAQAYNDALVDLGTYSKTIHDQLRHWIQLGQLANSGATEQMTLGEIRGMIAGLRAFSEITTAMLVPPAQPARKKTSGHALPRPRMPSPAHQPAQSVFRRSPPALTSPIMPLPMDQEHPPVILGSMPRVSDFVGRGHTVMHLSLLLRQGHHVALVPMEDGLAGIGLSTLAAETAALLEQDKPPNFPGGIVSLHCYGRQGEQGLQWIYTELGLAWSAPIVAQAGSLSAQEQEIRRMLIGRQALIILDHVELGLPVQRLMNTLTATQATLLITAREVPHAEQIHILRLGALNSIPALTFMQNKYLAAQGAMSGWDETIAREIASLLRFIPLAMTLAAGLAATDISFAGLAQRLQTARERGLLYNKTDANQAVYYLLELAQQHIDAATHNRLIGLAIFAGASWSEAAASEVLYAVDSETGAAAAPAPADTLRELARLGVLQPDQTPFDAGRYRLQTFARERMVQQLLMHRLIASAAGQAMASHYAGLALNRGKTGNAEFMRAEYIHMEAGLIWSRQQGAADLTVAYGMGLYRYWQQTGRWREAKEYLRWAVQAALNIGDRPREAVMAQQLAICVAHLGQQYPAREYYLQSLRIWQELGNVSNQATVLFDLAKLVRDNGDREQARNYYRESLRLAKEAGNEQAQARALQAMGLLAEEAGDVEEARRYYEIVFEMRQQAQDLVGQAGALNVLGVLEFHRRHYDAAHDHLAACLKFAIQANNDFWQAEAHFWLGETLLAQRKPQEALAEWQQALALYIRQGRTGDIAGTQQRIQHLIA